MRVVCGDLATWRAITCVARCRIVSPPKQWGRDAAIARANMMQAQQRLRKSKKARRAVRTCVCCRSATGAV